MLPEGSCDVTIKDRECTLRAAKNRIAHKHFRLDALKIKRAQKLLGTSTETEMLERTLDEVISELERNRLAWEANERFLRSRPDITEQPTPSADGSPVATLTFRGKPLVDET